MAKKRIPWADKEAAIRALEKDGRVDPWKLIDAASDPKHPCHGDFTWDVEEAARERWWEQAAALIRGCKFIVQVEDVGEPVVMYVSHPDTDIKEYVSLPKMRKKADTIGVVLAEVRQLCGDASRAYGIALSKSNIIGPSASQQLLRVRDQLFGLREELSE